jgi:SRSO17 transposase
VVYPPDLVIVEEDLAAWSAGLDGLFAQVAGRFFRPEPRRRARAYVRGLLAPLAGKNGWTLAEVAGDATPDGMQRLLNAANWDADGVRDDLRSYVVEHLGEPGGVLIVDETGFLKKGLRSAGVQRQYSGTAGRIENCQLGVFLAYVTSKGRTLIDRELYLPKTWTADRGRCQAAAIPEEIEFATKTVLAQQMLDRALAAGVPAAWITADEAYGQDYKFRTWCEKRRIGYVVAVPRSRPSPPEPGPAEPTTPPLTHPRARGSAAAAPTGPRARGYSTGQWHRCRPGTTPHPGGGAGCWSAARSSPPSRPPQARSRSWPTTCAPARPAPPTRS